MQHFCHQLMGGWSEAHLPDRASFPHCSLALLRCWNPLLLCPPHLLFHCPRCTTLLLWKDSYIFLEFQLQMAPCLWCLPCMPLSCCSLLTSPNLFWVLAFLEEHFWECFHCNSSNCQLLGNRPRSHVSFGVRRSGWRTWTEPGALQFCRSWAECCLSFFDFAFPFFPLSFFLAHLSGSLLKSGMLFCITTDWLSSTFIIICGSSRHLRMEIDLGPSLLRSVIAVVTAPVSKATAFWFSGECEWIS